MTNRDIISESTMSAIVGDAFAVFSGGVPTNTLCDLVQKATHHVLNSRVEAAFRILLEETKEGVFPSRTLDDLSPISSMTIRYHRAAIEGAARMNLRLMASVFKGVVQNAIIYPDKFQSMADRISDMTSEEIQAVSLVYRYKGMVDEEAEKMGKDIGYTDGDRIGREIFGDEYKNPDKILAYCSSASRTGLIMPQYDQNLFAYTATHIMDELVNLSDFQRILNEENIRCTECV